MSNELTQEGRIYKAMVDVTQFSVLDVYRRAKVRPLVARSVIKEELRQGRLVSTGMTPPNSWGLSFSVYEPTEKSSREAFLSYIYRHRYIGSVYGEAEDFLDPLPELVEALRCASSLLGYIKSYDSGHCGVTWRTEGVASILREDFHSHLTNFNELLRLGSKGMYEDGREAEECFDAYKCVVSTLGEVVAGDYAQKNLVDKRTGDDFTRAIGHLMLLGEKHAERAAEAARCWRCRTQR